MSRGRAKANAASYDTAKHPLIAAGGTLQDSLRNIEAYAAFLQECSANERSGIPGEIVRLGQYLAFRILREAIAEVSVIEASRPQ